MNNGNVGRGHGACPGEPESVLQPEIPLFGDMLQSMLQGCAHGLDALEGRLSAITRTDPPAGPVPQIAAVPPVAQTGMGSQIAGLCCEASSINDRIQSLLRRLEL